MEQDLKTLPEWSQAWAGHRQAQHISAGHEVTREQWTGLRDWLVALPTERPRMVSKLHKLTLEQALLASSKWHAEMAARQSRMAHERAGFGGDPDAVEVLASPPSANPAQQGVEQGWRWVRVTSPEGLDYEGSAMGHCVGRGGYDQVCIYSLRDPDNMPHCTIEWNSTRREVCQIQGRANGPVVPRYHAAVVAFINVLEPTQVKGAHRFDHVLVGGRLIHIDALEDGAVVMGDLNLSRRTKTLELPRNLEVRGSLDLTGSTGLVNLPYGLKVHQGLMLGACTSLECLPPDLQAERIALYGCTAIKTIPAGLSSSSRYIDLEDCTGLTHLPDDLHIMGSLDLRGCHNLERMPRGLQVGGHLHLMNCRKIETLPDDMVVEGSINLNGCLGLNSLPSGMHVKENLFMSGCTALQTLPAIRVDGLLSLQGCSGLEVIEPGLVALRLDLMQCTAITSLPEDVRTDLVRLNNCTGLTGLPDWVFKTHTFDLEGCSGLLSLGEKLRINGSLYLKGCSGLKSLPGELWVGDILDLRGCSLLVELPQDLYVGGDIYLTGCTSLQSLPADTIRRHSIPDLPVHLAQAMQEACREGGLRV